MSKDEAVQLLGNPLEEWNTYLAGTGLRRKYGQTSLSIFFTSTGIVYEIRLFESLPADENSVQAENRFREALQIYSAPLKENLSKPNDVLYQAWRTPEGKGMKVMLACH